MNFVVTGASGFIGTHLVRHLSECGHSGIAVSRRDLPESIPKWQRIRRDVVLGGKLGDLGSESVLIHLEVHHHVQIETESDKDRFREVNIEGTRTWLDWCGCHGVSRFLLFSSIKAVMAVDGVTDESAQGPGDSFYGSSKWEAENLVRRWVGAGVGRRAAIVRPAVVYGRGNAGNMGSLVEGIKRKRFALIGGGRTHKSVVSVRNVCSAVEYVSGRMQPGIEVFNLTDPSTHTVAEIAGFVCDALGQKQDYPSLPVPVMIWAAKAGDLFSRLTGRKAPLTTRMLTALLTETRFSGEKLKAAGFRHPETTRQGIADMVRSNVK